MSSLLNDCGFYNYFIAIKQEQIKNHEESLRFHTLALERLKDELVGLETARDAYVTPTNIVAADTPVAEPVEEAPKPKRKAKTKAAEPAPQVTLEEVRAVMIELARAGKREVAKEIIGSYGADALSSVDPTHFAEALSRAKEALDA